MSLVVDLLARDGLALLYGASALLGLGCLALLVCRAPLYQQRAGELALLAVLLWLPLALLPFSFLRGGAGVAAPEPGSLAPPGRGAPPLEAPGKSLPDAGAANRARPNAALRGTASGGTVSPDTEPDARRAGAAPALAAVATRAVLHATPPAGRTTRLPEPVPVVDHGRAIATLFLLGSAAALAWILLGVARLRFLRRGSRPAPRWVGETLGADGSLALELGLSVRVTDRRYRPFCAGWRRPTVFLHTSTCIPERAPQIREVILHEIGHVLRRDQLGHAMFALALPLLWFHPFYWWLRRRVRFASELLADDWAASRSQPADYARQLVDLARHQHTFRRPPVAAPAAHGSRSEFTRRIEMLLTREHELQRRCPTAHRFTQLGVTVAAALLTAGFWGVSPVIAQEAAPQDSVREAEQRIQELEIRLRDLQSELEHARRAQRPMRGPGALQPQPTLPWRETSPERSLFPPATPRAQGLPESRDPLAAPRASGQPPGLPPRASSPAPTPAPPTGESHPWPTAHPSGPSPFRLPPTTREITVRSGDSLARLAARYLGNEGRHEELLRLNPELSALESLRVGQRVRVPVEEPAPNLFGEIPILGSLFDHHPRSLAKGERCSDCHKSPHAAHPVAEPPVATPAQWHEGRPAREDAVDLATRVIQARGAMRLAQMQLARAEASELGGRSADLDRAAIELDTARETHDLLLRAVADELAASEAELREFEVRASDGQLGPRERAQADSHRMRLRARVQTLMGVAH